MKTWIESIVGIIKDALFELGMNGTCGLLYFMIFYALARSALDSGEFSSSGYRLILGATAVLSFVVWVINYRRLRTIGHTPLSKIDSAAQGYVELSGRAEPIIPLVSEITKTPCVWYRHQIEPVDNKRYWINIQPPGALVGLPAGISASSGI